jgi:hypothetical protein
MRFVSKSANFSAGNLRNSNGGSSVPRDSRHRGQDRYHPVAEAYVVTEALPIQFSQAGLLQSDIDAGLSFWKTFPGLPIEEDEVTPANPVEIRTHRRLGQRLPGRRSTAWTDEDREQAENMLLSSQYHGIEFFAVEEVKAASRGRPTTTRITTRLLRSLPSSASFAEALAYEQENKQRPTVIEQLETALPTESGEFVAA